jgi:hypothetical protein
MLSVPDTVELPAPLPLLLGVAPAEVVELSDTDTVELGWPLPERLALEEAQAVA